MGFEALKFAFDFKTETCFTCGVAFAFPMSIYNQRRNDKKEFFCINGHGQHYIGETEAQRVQREMQAKLDRSETQRGWAETRAADNWKVAERNKRKAAGFKGVLTKTKARVGRGICPCCNRQFENLQRHMSHLHPKYKTAKIVKEKTK